MRPGLGHEIQNEIEVLDSENDDLSKPKRTCCVPTCGKRFVYKSGMGYGFPSNETIQLQWLQALGMSTLEKCSIVCHIHFLPEHFVEDSKVKRLKKGIVPIIGPHQTSINKNFRNPVSKCCVPTCKKYFPNKPGKYYEFPTDEKCQEKWLEALGMVSFSEGDKVCFRHFIAKECLNYQKRKRLPQRILPIPIFGSSNLEPETPSPLSIEEVTRAKKMQDLWLESIGMSDYCAKVEERRLQNEQMKKKEEILKNEKSIEAKTSETQAFVKTEFETFSTREQVPSSTENNHESYIKQETEVKIEPQNPSEVESDPLKVDEMEFVGVIPRKIDLKSTKKMFPCQYCQVKFSEISDKDAHENGDGCFVKKLYQDSISKAKNRQRKFQH